jgi:hypothetical protein
MVLRKEFGGWRISKKFNSNLPKMNCHERIESVTNSGQNIGGMTSTA